MDEGLFQVETIIIELLLLASLIAIVVQRLRLPYTVALVAAGLIVGVTQPFLEQIIGPVEIDLTPELILTLFVPPLIFEAAFNLEFSRLRRDLPVILLLAVPGVIMTMFIVGGIISATTTLSFAVALVFGALMAATDPVAVIALFRSLGVPKRLAVLLEGESLLNDGTAIVVFGVVLTVATSGTVDLAEGLIDFLRVVAGGLALGVGVGAATAWLIARVDNHLIEISLTTVLAFGVYLLAERLHFSGVLAVVAAGLINGNMSERGMSPTTRIILHNFWEYIAFLANSLLFLLVGIEVNVGALGTFWQPILIAILAVLIARGVVIYSATWVVNRFIAERVPFRWQHIQFWGGLRGAISLALVLSLPAALREDRELLTTLTFGVVLFTLFVQGATIGPLLRWLGIVQDDAVRKEYDLKHARLIALQRSEEYLEQAFRQGQISTQAHDQLKKQVTEQVARLREETRALLVEHPELANAEWETARADMLRAQRGVFLNLRRTGAISEEVFEELAVEIDNELEHMREEGVVAPGNESPRPDQSAP